MWIAWDLLQASTVFPSVKHRYGKWTQQANSSSMCNVPPDLNSTASTAELLSILFPCLLQSPQDRDFLDLYKQISRKSSLAHFSSAPQSPFLSLPSPVGRWMALLWVSGKEVLLIFPWSGAILSWLNLSCEEERRHTVWLVLRQQGQWGGVGSVCIY